MMANLAQLQTAFVAAIFGHVASEKEILPQIKAGNSLDSRQCLDIYRASILQSLNGALSGLYPVIEKLLGESFFSFMVKEYAHQTPSIQPDLGEFGRNFSQFLMTFDKVKHLPYLSDVARLEWAWDVIFYAPDDPDSHFEKMSLLNEDELSGLRFRLTKSAQLIQSDYPLLDIWQANQTCEPSSNISLNSNKTYLLLLRQGDECRMDRVTEADWLLLKAIRDGCNFSQLIESVGGVEAVNALLPRYVQAGWIVGLDLDSAE